MLKEDFKNSINELMKDLEIHVKKITEYEIKLIEKEMIWINDEKIIKQKLIKICANLNIKKYKYCSSYGFHGVRGTEWWPLNPWLG